MVVTCRIVAFCAVFNCNPVLPGLITFSACKHHHYYLLGKGGYDFGGVGLSVCGQHYSKSYEQIWMKFYGGVLGSTMKN